MRRVHRALLEQRIWLGQLPAAMKPYESLIIRDDEVKVLLASTEHMTIQDLAACTGLNQEVIYQMMTDGILEHHTIMDAKSGLSIRVFEPEVAQLAKSELIMLRHLAGDSPRRGGTLKGQLVAAGIKPVSVTKISGNQAYVYRRSEVHVWL